MRQWWELQFLRSARKDYDAMPAADRERMERTLDRLIRNPSQVDLKKLQGSDDYRIRSGRWRAVISFNHALHIITVLQIDQRKDAYR